MEFIMNIKLMSVAALVALPMMAMPVHAKSTTKPTTKSSANKSPSKRQQNATTQQGEVTAEATQAQSGEALTGSRTVSIRPSSQSATNAGTSQAGAQMGIPAANQALHPDCANVPAIHQAECHAAATAQGMNTPAQATPVATPSAEPNINDAQAQMPTQTTPSDPKMGIAPDGQ